jgi:hypothetical protein
MADFNLEDQGQVHYCLWLELPFLLANLQPFVDLFSNRYGKVLIFDG